MLVRLIRLTLPPAIVLAALALYRLVFVFAFASPPKDDVRLPRREPLHICSRSHELRICSDEQLAAVLKRVKPPREPVNTNTLVHALRLWGAQADFGDDATPSGRLMLDYLLDDRVFQQLAGTDSPPIFFRGQDGIDVRSYDDSTNFQHTSSYHDADLLATLAEVGTPLDATLHLRDGTAQVSDLLEGTMRRFYLDRQEYEWTIIALARYAHPITAWRNKFGEKIDMEALVEELIDKPVELGPCDGLHRLEALVVLYRADEQSPSLPPRVKRRMLVHMKQVSDRLVQCQTVAGYWTRGWSGQSEVAPAMRDKLLVTGHHLEWLALAPEEVQPPRETIVRAGQWLTRALLELDDDSLLQSYGPYSHAARALCLWKGVEPGKVQDRSQGTADCKKHET
jgi:hypothetical protein